MRWPVLVLSLLLSACTTPVLKIPIGQAALIYADWKANYIALNIRITDACKAGKLPAETCAYLQKEDEKAKMIDADIRKGIIQARGEVDWDKVIQYAEVIAGMAVKAGGL
jgi:hypothetical protein